MGSGHDSDSYVSSLIKYLMFFFNFMFWLIGCALITIGSWAFTEKNRFKYENPKDSGLGDLDIYDLVFDLTVIMMVLGAVIFIIAFTGCIGALRENVCLLKFFSYVLGLIFLVEVVLAILAFVFSNEAKAHVTELLKMEGLARYRDDDDLRNLFDWIQKTFSCCGVGLEGFKDWSLNQYYNCTIENLSVERCGVPFSCCLKPDQFEESLINTMCGFEVQQLSYPAAQQRIYTTGCIDAVLTMAKDNLYLIGGVALGLAIPQLLGIFLARVLGNQADNQRKRWV